MTDDTKEIRSANEMFVVVNGLWRQMALYYNEILLYCYDETASYLSEWIVLIGN